MSRTIPKTMFDHGYERLWRETPRYMVHPFRVTVGDTGGPHFTGGDPLHKGIDCRQCHGELTLMWDIALADPIFPDYMRNRFAPATRLPFYICLTCVCASYLVISDEELTPFPFDGGLEHIVLEDDPPFIDCERVLPRRPLTLTPIPSVVDGLVRLGSRIGWNALDANALQVLSEYQGNESFYRHRLYISQLGGEQLKFQVDSGLSCANPECPTYGNASNAFQMLQLAVIHYPEEPTLALAGFQLEYCICGFCHTISCQYQCT